MIEDYDTVISNPIPTKRSVQRIINRKLKKRWSDDQRKHGLNFVISEDWSQLIKEDYSILSEYEKKGWVIFQYEKKTSEGVIRSLQFRNPHYYNKSK